MTGGDAADSSRHRLRAESFSLSRKGKQREERDHSAEQISAANLPDLEDSGRATLTTVDEELRDTSHKDDGDDDDDDGSMHCSICLSLIDNRTVVQPCGHDAYCFACIYAWTEQSRKCPLCNQTIELLVHSIRSDRDFQRFFLPPLPSTSNSPPLALQPVRSYRNDGGGGPTLQERARRQLYDRPTHPRFRYSDWKTRNRPAEMPQVDQEDLALEKRRYVYKHSLFVKHVASNRYTRYRDCSAQQIASSADLKHKLTMWLRRELQVFEGLDMEFLTTYIVSIASQLELRSDSATRLLTEFLGERDAEHLLHETYSFLRSPYKDLRSYDRAIQYDRPDCEIARHANKSARRTSPPPLASLSPQDNKPSLLPSSRSSQSRSSKRRHELSPDRTNTDRARNGRQRVADRYAPRDADDQSGYKKSRRRGSTRDLRRDSPPRERERNRGWRGEPDEQSRPMSEDRTSMTTRDAHSSQEDLMNTSAASYAMPMKSAELSDAEDAISLGSDFELANAAEALEHTAPSEHPPSAPRNSDIPASIRPKVQLSIRGLSQIHRATARPARTTTAMFSSSSSRAALEEVLPSAGNGAVANGYGMTQKVEERPEDNAKRRANVASRLAREKANTASQQSTSTGVSASSNGKPHLRGTVSDEMRAKVMLRLELEMRQKIQQGRRGKSSELARAAPSTRLEVAEQREVAELSRSSGSGSVAEGGKDSEELHIGSTMDQTEARIGKVDISSRHDTVAAADERGSRLQAASAVADGTAGAGGDAGAIGQNNGKARPDLLARIEREKRLKSLRERISLERAGLTQ